MAEELNRLQHMLNGNIKGQELKQLMRPHCKKPYTHPEQMIKQELVLVDLHIPARRSSRNQ